MVADPQSTAPRPNLEQLCRWPNTRQSFAFGPKAQRRRGTTSQASQEQVDESLVTVGVAGFGQAYPDARLRGLLRLADPSRAVAK